MTRPPTLNYGSERPRHRLIGTLLKLCLIVLALWGIYRLTQRTPQEMQNTNENDHDADDLPMPVVDVRVGVITRQTLRSYLTAYGTVEAAPATHDQPAAGARVAPPAAGIVSAVDCIEGQRVEKGQSLFHLDARAADAAVERARTIAAAASARAGQLGETTASSEVPVPSHVEAPLWQRSRAKQDLAIAQADLNRAIAERAVLDVASPLAGTVVDLRIRPGEAADPAAYAVEVDDLSRLVVVADIPAAQLRSVRIGQSARVQLSHGHGTSTQESALPAAAAATQPAVSAVEQPAAVAGTVAFIDDAIDARTGTGSVDIRLPSGAAVRPGQFLRVEIVREHPGCLSVPADAVATDADGSPVINLVYRETFQSTIPRRVAVGIRDGNAVEVTGEGLQAGDVVVTQGAYGLPPRTKIHILEP